MNLGDIKLDQVNTCESSCHRPEVAMRNLKFYDSSNAFQSNNPSD